VATELAELLADLDVRTVALDRWRIDVFKRHPDNIGCDLPMVPFGQGYKDMSPALDTLEAELLNRCTAHGGHPVL